MSAESCHLSVGTMLTLMKGLPKQKCFKWPTER